MFYDNFAMKCNEKNISPTAAAVEIGFHKSEVTRWKQGSTPRRANLLRIAKYFGCTADELIEEIEKPAPMKGNGLNKEYEEWVNAWEAATPEARLAALAVLRLQGRSSEDLD